MDIGTIGIPQLDFDFLGKAIKKYKEKVEEIIQNSLRKNCKLTAASDGAMVLYCLNTPIVKIGPAVIIDELENGEVIVKVEVEYEEISNSGDNKQEV